MLRKSSGEKVRCTDGGWVSLDAADLGLIESVYKKSIREGEERLMFAVLENAVECFQNNVFARRPSRKQLFQEAEEWFLDTENEALFVKTHCATMFAQLALLVRIPIDDRHSFTHRFSPTGFILNASDSNCCGPIALGSHSG